MKKANKKLDISDQYKIDNDVMDAATLFLIKEFIEDGVSLEENAENLKNIFINIDRCFNDSK